jgi:hypothetical protein
MQKKNIDQRYINFLLDVVSDRDKFPEKIKIFSWNYDSQILLATKILNFDAISRTRNIYEKKLNGEAVSDIISPIFNILEGVEVGEACNESADLYWRLMSSSDSDKKTRDNLRVRFAFEQNVENFVEKSSFLSSFQRITDVIIVGYSFPFSNREVDNNIFKAILGKSNIGDYGGKLNIYIQTPDKETFDTSRGKVASTLISINGQIKDDGRVLIYEPYQGRSSQIIIEHKWDRDNFYIPQTF